MKLFLTSLFVLSLSFAFSQAPVYDTSDENPDLAVQVDYILENLDMSKVAIFKILRKECCETKLIYRTSKR